MKKEFEARIKAAGTLLDRGVRVGGIKAPLFLRLFGKRTISVRLGQPCLGGCIEIDRELLEMQLEPSELGNITEREAMVLMDEHGERLCRVLAISILRGRKRIRWFTGMLSRWLLWHVKPVILKNCVHVIWVYGGVQDFSTTIGFLQATSVLTRKTSPGDQGSQEIN